MFLEELKVDALTCVSNYSSYDKNSTKIEFDSSSTKGYFYQYFLLYIYTR
jgi:hypothetical protein